MPSLRKSATANPKRPARRVIADGVALMRSRRQGFEGDISGAAMRGTTLTDRVDSVCAVPCCGGWQLDDFLAAFGAASAASASSSASTGACC
jgi:hypothetical protein